MTWITAQPSWIRDPAPLHRRASALHPHLSAQAPRDTGIAIDDFGTGFSSLGRLSELPIDTLKIDRMFTSRLPSDRKCCTLVSTIIDLAHAFDMTTVAEGVENQAQLDYLVRASCDESQGYLHSRPLPRLEFERWLIRCSAAAAGGDNSSAARA